MIKVVPGHVWLNIKTRHKYRVLGLGVDDGGEHFVIYKSVDLPPCNKPGLLIRHSETLQGGAAHLHACGRWYVKFDNFEISDFDAWVRPLWQWREKFRLLVKWEGKIQRTDE